MQLSSKKDIELDVDDIILFDDSEDWYEVELKTNIKDILNGVFK